MIVADYCTIKAKTGLVLANRFTEWVSVFFFHKKATAMQLITILWEKFSTFGVAENIATDYGSQCRTNEINMFLARWEISHKII